MCKANIWPLKQKIQHVEFNPLSTEIARSLHQYYIDYMKIHEWQDINVTVPHQLVLVDFLWDKKHLSLYVQEFYLVSNRNRYKRQKGTSFITNTHTHPVRNLSFVAQPVVRTTLPTCVFPSDACIIRNMWQSKLPVRFFEAFPPIISFSCGEQQLADFLSEDLLCAKKEDNYRYRFVWWFVQECEGGIGQACSRNV